MLAQIADLCQCALCTYALQWQIAVDRYTINQIVTSLLSLQCNRLFSRLVNPGFGISNLVRNPLLS